MRQPLLRAAGPLFLLWSLSSCTVPDLKDLEAERPRTCDESHPCLPGYLCLSGQCRVASPLGMRVSVPPAPTVAPAGGFTFTDPAGAAWRRDQVVAVRVEVDSQEVDEASLEVTVALPSPAAVKSLRPTRVVPGCGAGWCGTVEVALWELDMPAFRGAFTVTARARDRQGNEGRATASLPVTRWRWAFEGGTGPFRGAPAMGQQGTLYAATSGSQSTVYALAPEGTRLWEAQEGEVLSSPVVGRTPGGADRVYVLLRSGDGSLSLTTLEDGEDLSRCTLPSSPPGSSAALGLTTPQGSSLEVAVALVGGQQVLAAQPEASTPCHSAPATSVESASLVLKGSDAYTGNPQEGRILAFRFSSNGSWAGKQGFSAPSTPVSPRWMASTDDGWVIATGGRRSGATEDAGALAVRDNNGSSLWRFAQAVEGWLEAGPAAVGLRNTLYFGRWQDSGASQLLAVELGAGNARATAAGSGALLATPVLGETGELYTATAGTPQGAQSSELAAWSQDTLTPRWRLTGEVGRVEGSPNLDCVRDAQGAGLGLPYGLLYVPSMDGKLYAFLVDSPKLSAAAPWPRFQHDARNSGNPGIPHNDNCP
jgi:outer membrane protein assembly factor BamB